MWYPDFWPRRNDVLIATAGATVVAALLFPAASTSAELREPGVVRWTDADARRIRVWIANGNAVRAWKPELNGRVIAAFAAWSTTGAVGFEMVDGPAAADVRVMWTDRLVDRARDVRVNGLTRSKLNDRDEITHADVYIALERPSGRVMSAAAIEAIALHEVGHAIGLVHSRDSSDVMYPTVQVRGLSRADVRAVRALYATHFPVSDVPMASAQ